MRSRRASFSRSGFSPLLERFSVPPFFLFYGLFFPSFFFPPEASVETLLAIFSNCRRKDPFSLLLLSTFLQVSDGDMLPFFEGGGFFFFFPFSTSGLLWILGPPQSNAFPEPSVFSRSTFLRPRCFFFWRRAFFSRFLSRPIAPFFV